MDTPFRNLLTASLVVVLAACASAVKTEHPAPITSAGANARAVAPVNVEADELNNPNSPLAKRSVYFDFDAYVVKPEYTSLLEAHAKYLVSHPQRHILIQGNTDERGTSEYNLALGQRRSAAVLRELATLGVPTSQMEAVSFGKEKPRALGHDEAAWAENRRADIVYGVMPR